MFTDSKLIEKRGCGCVDAEDFSHVFLLKQLGMDKIRNAEDKYSSECFMKPIFNVEKEKPDVKREHKSMFIPECGSRYH